MKIPNMKQPNHTKRSHQSRTRSPLLWFAALVLLIFASPSPIRAQDIIEPDLPGIGLDDDATTMQMEDAGEGDNKRFRIVTAEDVSTVAVGDIYKNNSSYFKVAEILRKGTKGGKFVVERIRGKFDPTLKWDRVSGEGPLMIQSRETMVDRFLTGGALMWPLVALLLLTIILTVRSVFYYRTEAHCSEDYLDSCKKAIKKGDLDRFEEVSIKQKGLLASCARAMMIDFEESDKADLQAHAQGAARRQVARMRFPVKLLGFIAVVAPLLGLLGTVIGMIQCFDSVAGQAADQAKAIAMAAGIKKALMTTAFGLIVAVPALFVAFLFNFRLRLLVTDCEAAADDLILRISRLVKQAIPASETRTAGPGPEPGPEPAE